jgi:AcrR family transcriptional regulator
LAYHHGNLRAALLERAAEVIAEQGIEGLSLRGLARDLGVSHAAPRAHFADRNALLAELAKDGFRRSIEAMNAGAAEAGLDPVERYRALIRSYVQFALENPACFRTTIRPEVRAHASRELMEALGGIVKTLHDGARAAQEAGWHPEHEPDTLVAFAFATAIGTAAMFSDPKWAQVLGIQDANRLADSILDLVMHRDCIAALLPLRGEPGSGS